MSFCFFFSDFLVWMCSVCLDFGYWTLWFGCVFDCLHIELHGLDMFIFVCIIYMLIFMFIIGIE